MCCGLRIICDDGNVLVSRTLEFGMKLNYKSVETEEIKGVRGWIKDVNDSYFIDGINKSGLVCMAFYFPKYDRYSKEKKNGFANIQSLQVVEFILLNCNTIEDVKNICKKMNVLDIVYEPVGFVFPLHWFCSDKYGNCIVIEYVDGRAVVYDNPLGIMTNSPTFPEHIKSIQSNRVQKLTPKADNNKTQIQAKSIGIELPEEYSTGTGMIGLPGDYSSISRFVKLYVLQKYSQKSECLHQGINNSLHILNNFDILKGTTVGQGHDEYTQYTVVYDTLERNIYFKTYENQMISRF